MSYFTDTMAEQSKILLSRFSLPLDVGFEYTHQPALKNGWVDDVVMKHPELSVKADLTFRHAINETPAPIMDGCRGLRVPNKPVKPSRRFITHGDAIINIAQFVERLNYACYKNAYRRYGKKLSIVSAIEGGNISKTISSSNGRKTEYDYATGKHIHAHLILSRPTHILYDDFEKLIAETWLATKWGLYRRRIEPIKSLKGVAKYQVKSSLDALDLQNTNLP